MYISPPNIQRVKSQRADEPAVDDSSADHDAAIAQATFALALTQLHSARLRVVDGRTRGH
jgi:hypothetical protein